MQEKVKRISRNLHLIILFIGFEQVFLSADDDDICVKNYNDNDDDDDNNGTYEKINTDQCTSMVTNIRMTNNILLTNRRCLTVEVY